MATKQETTEDLIRTIWTNGYRLGAKGTEPPEHLVKLAVFAFGRLCQGPQALEVVEFERARDKARIERLTTALERLANEMQSASSQGDPVCSEWLDRRIRVARDALANPEAPATDQP